MTTGRRDAGRPRGKPIEQAILAATLGELAAHGLEGLSVPRVAASAEVNKTSIYRRWPTKEALVAAALAGALRDSAAEIHDTGSLRGDLLRLVHIVAARMDSAEGRALARAALSEQASAAVTELSDDPSVREQANVLALVARAAARGEWTPSRHSPEVVLSMVTGGVLHRLLMERRPVTPEWAETLVDVVVRGLA